MRSPSVRSVLEAMQGHQLYKEVTGWCEGALGCVRWLGSSVPRLAAGDRGPQRVRNRHEQHRKGKDPVLLVVTAGTQPKTKEQAQIDEERIEKAKHPNRQKTKKTADGRVIDGEEDTGEVCEVFESPFWYRTARGLPHSTKLKVRQQPRPDAKVLGVVPEGHAVRCIAGGGDWLMCSFGKVDNAWILCRTGKREIFTLLDAAGAVTTWRDDGDEERAALRRADANILERCIESGASPFAFAELDPMRQGGADAPDADPAIAKAEAAAATAAAKAAAEGDAGSDDETAPAADGAAEPKDEEDKAELAAEAHASVEAAVAAEPGPEKKKSRFGFGSKKS